MGKGLRVGMNRDLQVQTQNALLRLFSATNQNIDELRGRIKKVQEAQELFYETFMAHTWRGRFKRLVKWLSKKRNHDGRLDKEASPELMPPPGNNG